MAGVAGVDGVVEQRAGVVARLQLLAQAAEAPGAQRNEIDCLRRGNTAACRVGCHAAPPPRFAIRSAWHSGRDFLAAPRLRVRRIWPRGRSEEHTSEFQSLMRKTYAVFC